MIAYCARWIFPVDAPPIEQGTLFVDGGRIAEVSRASHPTAIDLGRVALLPALVNAHTHLELSDFSRPLENPLPFSDWIRAVIGHRRTRDADAGEPENQQRRQIERVATALYECRAAGAGLIADICTGPSLSRDDERRIISDNVPHATEVWSFREFIGLLPEQWETQLQAAREHLRVDEREETSPLRRALSPHAPYSVHPELFEHIVDLACSARVPLAMHLAETRAELELLSQGRGELVEMLREFGLWRDDLLPRGRRPLDYLRSLARAERALVVHGNYLSRDELEFAAQHPGLTVVYCPRTHRYFQHAAHPWRALLELGGNVALGTDSRASNPDLSLWNELLFLRAQFPDVDPELLLEMGTLRGARALGREDELGSLAPGKLARLAVVELSSDSADPYAALFDRRSRIVPGPAL